MGVSAPLIGGARNSARRRFDLLSRSSAPVLSRAVEPISTQE